LKFGGAVAAAACLAGCQRRVIVGSEPAPQAPASRNGASAAAASIHAVYNVITPPERAQGWTLLFDGRDLSQWRGYRMDSLPAGWAVRDGVIEKTGSAEDLVTRRQFANFDLKWDWMIAPGGNAGVFYRATEEYEHVYWSGPEYQLLDDARHPDGKSRLTSAAADYAVYPSPEGFLNPAGTWNSSEIIVNGNHVEHWLNGHQMVAYDLKSPDWAARVKASKFSAWPHYGLASSGYIGLQGDHDGELQLRNIKIRVLP
jgi:hypothetical protein